MMKKYLLALLGLALVIRVSAQIVGGAGVCAVRGNPNSIATLTYQAPAQECLLAVDTLTWVRYRYDRSLAPGARWVVEVNGGGSGSKDPDSTFAKTGGAAPYSGKRISDNVYRTGKLGFNTTDTLATLNLRSANPVGSVLTWLYNYVAPPRSAYKGPTWTNSSQWNLSRIDINPMKPAHFPSFNYGVWTDQLFVDSTTNSAVGAPGNSLRNVGFNVDGANPKMARWYWSTEQYYYPGNGGSIDWEHHLEVRDTLNRHNRPFNLNARHNGNFYGAGFRVNEFYFGKPFSGDYGLRVNLNTGEWSTDYPYTFRINNSTRVGRIIERLHGGSPLNVLDWETTGRLQVGDRGGLSIDNKLYFTYTSGQTPKIVSQSGNFRFDTTELAIRVLANRQLTLEKVGTSERYEFLFDGTFFAFGTNVNTAQYTLHKSAPNSSFSIDNTGRVGLGLGDAFAKLHIQQPIDDLSGGLMMSSLAGPYVGLYSAAGGELNMNFGGSNRKLFAQTTAPNGTDIASPADLKLRDNSGTGELWGKYSGYGSNTGWGKFLNLIDPNSATSGQVLTWNGTAWVPTTQTITGIGTFQTAGNAAGLSIATNQLRGHRVTATTPGMLSTLDDTKTGSLTNITTDAYNFIAQNTGTGLFGFAFKNNAGVTKAELTADETAGGNVFLNFGGQQSGRGLDNFISCDGDTKTVKVFDGLTGTFQSATTQVERFADINTAGALDADYSIQYINLGTSGTMTIPNTFPTGTKLDLYNLSGGGVTVTVQPGGGETIRGGNISFTSTDQRVTLRKRGTEWIHWE